MAKQIQGVTIQVARADNRIRALAGPILVTRHTQTAGRIQTGNPIQAGDAPTLEINLIPVWGAATLVVSLIQAGGGSTLADKVTGAEAIDVIILQGEETISLTGAAAMVAVMATRADTTARGMAMDLATGTPMLLVPAITLRPIPVFQPVTTINGTAGFPTQAVT